MSHQAFPISVKRGLLTPGTAVLCALALVGLAAALYRFVFGLGAATNLNNQYPWGLWIAIDVASGVALAAGGFTSAAVAHIFHRHRYEALIRPALLTAMLGYTFAVLGLLADLGRFYNIWHPVWPTMWQGNSVLFEVAMCVMIYLHVLYIEFLPVVCERFVGKVRFPGPLRILNGPIDALLRQAQKMLGKTMFVFIIAGIVLSCLHQSSLGTLLVIAPYKLSPLWYTPILPMLFLLSAVMVGFSMVIFESLLAAWSFRRKPEMDILGPYSRFMLVALGAYMIAKGMDFLLRDAYRSLADNQTASIMFAIEIFAGIVLPFLMLLSQKARRSPIWLFSAAALAVAGVVLNRINVFLVGFRPPYAQTPYFPSGVEILVTVGLIATLMLTYRVCVTIFPVLPGADAETAELPAALDQPLPIGSEPDAA